MNDSASSEHGTESGDDETASEEAMQKSSNHDSGFSWFIFGWVGLWGCLIMSTACVFGSCGRWASEIWLGLGLFFVAIAVGGLEA